VSLSDWLFGSITSRLGRLEIQGTIIMATAADLEAKITAIGTAADAERVEVQGLLGGLRDQIQSLQDLIAQGSQVTPEQLDALGFLADSITARVQGISEPVAP
jgi:hypothetical protein